MKYLKILTICAAAALLLGAPATALAKTHFSLSINLFDCLPRIFVAPPPPPIMVPCPPPPYVEHRTVIKEYHYYGNRCDCPECCETIQPYYPQQKHYPPHQTCR